MKRPPIKPLPSVELLASLFLYDPDAGILWWRHGACRRGSGRPAGTVKQSRADRNTYVVVAINKSYYKAHRIIWKMVTGQEPPPFIDHEDMDSTNNRWRNLRVASNGQNISNAKLRTDNKSGVKGVCWDSGHKKWVASIGLNRKQRRLGRFNTVAEAAAVVNAARQKLHGEFARTG